MSATDFKIDATNVMPIVIPGASPSAAGVMTAAQAATVQNQQLLATNWTELSPYGLLWFIDAITSGGSNRYARFMHPAAPQIVNPLVASSEWLGSVGVGAELNTNPIRMEVDGIDTQANQINKGGAAQRVVLQPALAAAEVLAQSPLANILQICWQYTLALPDLSLAGFKSGDLTSWTGSNAAAMDPTTAKRRLAIQFEKVHAPRFAAAIPLARPSYSSRMQARFRGFGATTSAAQLDQTEDGRMGAASAGGAPTAFQAMALGDGGVGDTGTGPAVSYGTQPPPGAPPFEVAQQVARMQWVIEIPNTVSPGDYIDLTGLEYVQGAATPAALNALLLTDNGIQIWGYKYRFIQSPFPFATNSGVQLAGVNNQPRTIPRKTPTFF